MLKFIIMILRPLVLFALILVFISFTNVSAGETGLLNLVSEPTVRIGLATNARSVSITTTDSSLVAVSPDEPNKMLATNKVFVAPRAYRPPEIEFYKFEIQNLESQTVADALAADVREAGEKAFAMLGIQPNTWRVIIGDTKETIEDANQYKADLAEKGFEDVVIITEKKTQPSEDAIALSQQLKQGGKTENRSLIQTTGSTQPTTNTPIDANLKEILVSGSSESAKFSSFKPLAFGSVNERAVPVKLNGKAYRGKIEVFVNTRGTLTVVNVVSLEDYLLGVVPRELGLPSLEAQKAQAVAARTYAIANRDGFATQGFDLLPTVWSQVYGGVSAENSMGTQAVQQTRGIVATYNGKPINALYTSTCGGRTENSGNIFDFDEPYLRGVECSFEGRKYFEPFLIKTQRAPARLRDEQNLQLVRFMSLLAVNSFQLNTNPMTDDWFEDAPTQSEISNWMNNLASKFGKTYPNVTKDTAKPAELARLLVGYIYPDAYADTLLSDSDVSYQLSFDDAAEIPKDARANIAVLLRDGYFTIYPDLTLKPNKPFSRAKMLRLIQQIYEKKKWLPTLQSGVTEASENGALNIRQGKTKKTFALRPDVFLFRQFGDDFYQVKETALVGGETVNFQTDAAGAVVYLEIKPTVQPTVAEKMSPFTMWNANLSAGAMQSRLSRYVRGIGSLIDVNIKQKGYSRRATELEIVGTNGRFSLKGGKIRSALRLKEQLFVMNKRYDSSGRAISYSFTGRGWGHGVGMCQYGAYGLGKMGVKYDAILKHYYTGIELTNT
ncbi:MAG TPA: SpoIID/LytB domain-containing protein [Pyrinomonadaceae bacterium]|nr:SpoIID/LytB domain-containing protein [Pyrinomonadaceae bacterium]